MRTRQRVDAEVTTETVAKGDVETRQRSRPPVTETIPVTMETGFSENVEVAVGEVMVEGSMTYNLGNFNSARMSAHIKLPIAIPIYIEGDGQDEVRSEIVVKGFNRASDMLQQKMDHEYNSFTSSMNEDQLDRFYTAQES